MSKVVRVMCSGIMATSSLAASSKFNFIPISGSDDVFITSLSPDARFAVGYVGSSQHHTIQAHIDGTSLERDQHHAVVYQNPLDTSQNLVVAHAVPMGVNNSGMMVGIAPLSYYPVCTGLEYDDSQDENTSVPKPFMSLFCTAAVTEWIESDISPSSNDTAIAKSHWRPMSLPCMSVPQFGQGDVACMLSDNGKKIVGGSHRVSSEWAFTVSEYLVAGYWEILDSSETVTNCEMIDFSLAFTPEQFNEMHDARIVWHPLADDRDSLGSLAVSCSADGNIIGGFTTSGNNRCATIWQGDSVLVYLGNGMVSAISPNGKYAALTLQTNEGQRAARYNLDTQTLNCTDQTMNMESFAVSVSDNGILLGNWGTMEDYMNRSVQSDSAFIFSTGGIQSLKSFLLETEILPDSLKNFEFKHVAAISADGHTVAGWGIDTSNRKQIGFFLQIPEITEDSCISETPLNSKEHDMDWVGDKNDRKVYPNPVEDVLFVDSAIKMESLSIWNIKGQLICQFYRPSQNVFQLKELPKGLYFVKIETFKDVSIVKIIKE